MNKSRRKFLGLFTLPILGRFLPKPKQQWELDCEAALRHVIKTREPDPRNTLVFCSPQTRGKTILPDDLICMRHCDVPLAFPLFGPTMYRNRDA